MSFSTLTEISLVPLTEPADGVPSSGSPQGAPAAPAPGELIGTYRVTHVIGFGAMGVVVAARDEALGRDVAIKVIRTDLSHPSFRQRFREEAQAMALVNHPHVVTIYSYGEHQGAPYFAMELVHGRSLDRLMDERGPLDLEFAVGLLDQACGGLAAIHASGAVHRDIKPANILVDDGSRLRLGDLGLAASFRDSDTPREVVGTPGYMAPEVIGESSATPLSDLYSLACVAYEMLTGRRPFEATGAPKSELLRPSLARPGLPAAFDAVLLEALAHEPERRTPSVELFRRALNQALNDAFEPTRILIVDDDDDQRESLQSGLELEFAGADIETAADGAAALAAFDRKPASVIVSDLNMPDVDGTSLTALLRARDDAKTVPIIVLTGWGGPREWRELASIGADRFVVKPVNLGDLCAAIRRALRERHANGAAHG